MNKTQTNEMINDIQDKFCRSNAGLIFQRQKDNENSQYIGSNSPSEVTMWRGNISCHDESLLNYFEGQQFSGVTIDSKQSYVVSDKQETANQIGEYVVQYFTGQPIYCLEPTGIKLITPSIERMLAYRFSEISFVKAVFLTEDEEAMFVYTVVEEFSPNILETVMDVEEKVSGLFPEKYFDFRLRASQGRDPSLVVPINAKSVFLR